MAGEEGKGVPDWFCGYKMSDGWSGTFHPVVGVTGLEPSDNLHPSFWENVNVNKDFSPKYIATSIPQRKQRRDIADLPSYVPEGLLQTNWADKHRNHVAAVTVAFFHQQARDATPQALMQLREECKIHGSQLLVMLIRGPEEEELSTERASAIYNAADIPPKSLFILTNSHPDRICNSMQRLQTGMREAAKAYYAGRIRRVKNNLEKTLNHSLKVRYNIKLGFFQEIRRDYISAMGHYEGALESLQSISVSEENSQEVKLVAGLLCYRMCRLHLLRLDWKAATSQFEKHLKIFTKMQGLPQLRFEHLAWLQQQYHNMGDLLKGSYRRGNPNAVDPASYFISAAKFGQERAALVKTINPDGIFTKPEGIENYFQFIPKYLGHRPSPLDMSALQYLHLIFPHSEQIITHLGVASEFCREIGHLRSRCQLMFLMGEEFSRTGEHRRSCLFMSHVLREFGRERWTQLLFNVADIGFKSAAATADIPSFLNFLVVLLKLDLKMFVGEIRTELSQILEDVLQKRVPKGPLFEEHRSLWEKALESPAEDGKLKSYVAVHQEGVIEGEFWLTEDVTNVYSECLIQCRIRSRHDAPLHIQSVGVQLSGSVDEATRPLDITLQPKEVFETTISYVPQLPDANKLVQLQMGLVDIGKGDVQILLHFPLIHPPTFSLWGEGGGKDTHRIVVKVDGRKVPLVCNIESKEPILVGEIAEIVVTWTNEDSNALTNLVLNFDISGATSPCKDVQLGIYPSDVSPCLSVTSEVGRLEPSASHKTTLRMIHRTEQELNLTATAKFLETGKSGHVTKEKICPLQVVHPFEFSHYWKYHSGDVIDLVSSYRGILLFMEVVGKANAKFIIHSMEFLFHEEKNFENKGSNLEAMKQRALKQGEKLTIMGLPSFFGTIPSLPNATLGSLNVFWTREGESENKFKTEHTVKFPSKDMNSGLVLTAEFDRAFLKQPLRISYVLFNPTASSQNLNVAIDSTEFFMNAGPKKLKVQLKSEDCIDFQYILFPLKTGLVAAPKLLIETADQQPLSVLRDVPKTIFVTRAEEEDVKAKGDGFGIGVSY